MYLNTVDKVAYKRSSFSWQKEVTRSSYSGSVFMTMDFTITSCCTCSKTHTQTHLYLIQNA